MLDWHPDITTQTIDNDATHQKKIQLGVLRLDELHPVVSGNKLFKLHYFLNTAKPADQVKIMTFGGAYSNHLVATACACRQMGINCVGIVRGEQPKKLSHSLQNCIEYGMQLQFISREAYSKKDSVAFLSALKEQHGAALVIPEGGYSSEGANGASLIMQYVPDDITHICCAAGTATTAAGLLMKLKPHQQLIVFPVLKGMHDLEERIDYLTQHRVDKTQLRSNNDYHFGGYAKKTPELLQFMNALYLQFRLPTDFVYTAKMMYGVLDLLEKDFFAAGSKLMCIHSGGLQGNLSLPAGTLTF